VFTLDDLWKIIDYLHDGTQDTINPLSPLTTSLATSEKELISTYFENIIDQPVFSSDDFKRLRSLLMDWYAAHRTISSTQKTASDVHALPNDHLSELFRSFGFPIGLNLVPLSAKANFFLDLVNFYKKKGTPETLVDVLEYYGFSDTDLVEYWLLKDISGNFVFRGESVRTSGVGSGSLLDSDVTWSEMTDNDPHWMMNYSDVQPLVDANKINLPSKTPYFSLSSVFLMTQLFSIMALISRLVQDQYDYGLVNGFDSLEENIVIKNIGEVVSLLVLYIAIIYVIESEIGVLPSSSALRCSHYNGTVNYIGTPPIPTNLYDIIEEYNDLMTRPSNRTSQRTIKDNIVSGWSTPKNNNFLIAGGSGTAEALLTTIHPDLKSIIDVWITSGETEYLLTYLIGSLDFWIRNNIYSSAPSLVITLLGLGFRDEILNIINFFKPLRARLAFLDTMYSIQDPVHDNIIFSDGDEDGDSGYDAVVVDVTSYITTVVDTTENLVIQLEDYYSERLGRRGFRGGYYESGSYDGLSPDSTSYIGISGKTIDHDDALLTDVYYDYDDAGGLYDKIYPIGDALTIKITDF
jgi:hypothetical protein